MKIEILEYKSNRKIPKEIHEGLEVSCARGLRPFSLWDHNNILIAVYKTKVVGYLIYNDPKIKDEPCHVQEISVRSRYRRRGIGSKLLECLEGKVKGRIHLETNEYLKTGNFYNKMGYKQTNRGKRYQIFEKVLDN